MVRLPDLKLRINPLSKTKPRLNQSYIDLHDLSRKNTVFDKLKRRFSNSEKDLSKLVAVNFSRDCVTSAADRHADGGFVVYNVMSSHDHDSHTSSDGDLDHGSTASRKPVRRHSSTFDGFSDIIDIIQGKVLHSNSKAPEKGEVEQYKMCNECECDGGMILVNKPQVDEDFDDEAFEEYNQEIKDISYVDESFVLITGSNEQTASKRDSKKLNDCATDCRDSLHEGMGGSKEEKLRRSADSSIINTKIKNHGEDYLNFPESLQIRDCPDMDNTPDEVHELGSKKVQTSFRSAVYEEGGSLAVLKTTASSEDVYNESEDGLLLSPYANSENNIDQQVDGSSNSHCDKIDPKTSRSCDVDLDPYGNQSYGVNEKLTVSNSGDQHTDYDKRADGGISLNRSDQGCDSCRCISSSYSSKTASYVHGLLETKNIVETSVDHRVEVYANCNTDDNIEFMENYSKSLKNAMKFTSTARSLSEENILEKESEPKRRTRRLHSAPNLYQMSADEKATLERTYEKNNLRERSTSLKSAIKKRSTDHNGNVLRVRFDMSKSDDELEKLRCDRAVFDSPIERANDKHAMITEANSNDEQKKSMRYVIKKFRIKQTLVDLGVTDKTRVDKDKKLADEELKSYDNRKLPKNANEAEISLESIREFSLLLPAKGTQKSFDGKKNRAEDKDAYDSASGTKIRYVD